MCFVVSGLRTGVGPAIGLSVAVIGVIRLRVAVATLANKEAIRCPKEGVESHAGAVEKTG